MGHIRLGELPRTRKWSQVVGLLEGGAGTAQIANATIQSMRECQTAEVARTSVGKVSYESSPSDGDRYAYTSREREVEIDLQYNRARYFDWNTGRWISQDPLGFDAGDSNLYRYVRNGPVSAGDPTGLLRETFDRGD